MLEINLLGSFEARIDGELIETLNHRKANRLLALLILENNRRVQRQWIEVVLDISYASLRKAESALRTALGDEGRRIRVVNNSLYMDVAGVAVDALTFEGLVQKGDIGSLNQALNIYRGELLKDWDGGWIVNRREDLQESYLDAIQMVVRYSIQRDEIERAASLLRRFTRIYPRMDSAWAQLIEVYGQLGQAEAARRTYESYLAALDARSIVEGRDLRVSDRVTAALSMANAEQKARFESADRHFSAVRADVASADPATDARPPAVPNSDVVFEPVGGSVPLTSKYYIKRPVDNMASKALLAKSSFVLIKGPRQVGKTSLLARLLNQGREREATVLFTDWQKIPQSHIEDARGFLIYLSETIADQLGIEFNAADQFNSGRPPTRCFERFLVKHVFPSLPGWIVWGIDEADRLFDCDYRDDIFGMLRSWHNERSIDPGSDWKRFSIVLSYATEAYLIKNLNQSPFNVGFPVELQDFTIEQVGELNALYGNPLQDDNQIQRLYALIGGHPFLIRQTLQEMILRETDVDAIEAEAASDRGCFRDHLDRMRLAILRDQDLAQAVRDWLGKGSKPSIEHYGRLSAAGVCVGASPADMRARCRLYEQYLKRAL